MPKPSNTRRDFLSGKAAADALAATGEGQRLASPSEAPCTLSLSRQAMACEFQVQLCTSHERNETDIGMAALDLVDELEDRLSVYRPHSEIMRLNRDAQAAAVEVSPSMFLLLTRCEELYNATAGAFDATTGPLSRVWGFYERRGRMPRDEELADAMRLVGWRHVQLDREKQTLRLLLPSVEVNFNGIGKGYALDQAAELMLHAGASDFLLHGGRSTLVARGNRPSGAPGWATGLRHPLRPERLLAEVALVDQAFSTSGNATQGFVHQGQRYGHVLDPRTGQPATGLHSVSVLAPDGVTADALSTALFVMGFESAWEFCEDHPEIGALFVLPNKGASSVRIEAINLAEERWRPAETG